MRDLIGEEGIGLSRFPKGLLLAIGILCWATVAGCGLAGQDSAHVETTEPAPVTPVQPPANPPQPASGVSADGLSQPIKDAIVTRTLDDSRYAIGHWLATGDKYCLVEVNMEPTGEHVYF